MPDKPKTNDDEMEAGREVVAVGRAQEDRSSVPAAAKCKSFNCWVVRVLAPIVGVVGIATILAAGPLQHIARQIQHTFRCRPIWKAAYCGRGVVDLVEVGALAVRLLRPHG